MGNTSSVRRQSDAKAAYTAVYMPVPQVDTTAPVKSVATAVAATAVAATAVDAPADAATAKEGTAAAAAASTTSTATAESTATTKTTKTAKTAATAMSQRHDEFTLKVMKRILEPDPLESKRCALATATHHIDQLLSCQSAYRWCILAYDLHRALLHFFVSKGTREFEDMVLAAVASSQPNEDQTISVLCKVGRAVDWCKAESHTCYHICTTTLWKLLREDVECILRGGEPCLLPADWPPALKVRAVCLKLGAIKGMSYYDGSLLMRYAMLIGGVDKLHEFAAALAPDATEDLAHVRLPPRLDAIRELRRQGAPRFCTAMVAPNPDWMPPYGWTLAQLRWSERLIAGKTGLPADRPHRVSDFAEVLDDCAGGLDTVSLRELGLELAEGDDADPLVATPTHEYGNAFRAAVGVPDYPSPLCYDEAPPLTHELLTVVSAMSPLDHHRSHGQSQAVEIAPGHYRSHGQR